MSKKENVPMASWGFGYVSSAQLPDRLNGQLFEVIEAIGLPSKQEESVKSLVQKTVWKTFEDCVFITSERHDEIRKMYYQKKKEADILGNPVSAI